MCLVFGKSGGGRSAGPRPVELSSHVPRDIREVKTLESWGYFAVESGLQHDPTDRSSPLIKFYTINHVQSGPNDPHIVLLGASEVKGLLYGYFNVISQCSTDTNKNDS